VRIAREDLRNHPRAGDGASALGGPDRSAGTRGYATTMYRDMGMTYWLEKAEAERELAG